MANPFANLKTDGLEENTDRLGGGFQAKESDAYEATIKVAYAGQSQGGARSVTFLFDLDGSEFRETIYVTNRKGENFFLNKNDQTKKVALPGFTTVEDICLITTGAELSAQAIEDKLVNVWDNDAKREMPKSMPVLIDLVGKKVGLAILKQLVDVNEKDSNGTYVPSGKTREENTIDKAFDLDSRLTVVEATKELEAKFIDTWVEKNKGVTRDKTAKNDNGPSARTGRPAGAPPQAGGPAKTKSLFGNKG